MKRKLLPLLLALCASGAVFSQTWNTEATAQFANDPKYLATTIHPTTGEIYVAYVDETDSDHLKVKKSDGSTWTDVGSNVSTLGNVLFPSIRINPDTEEVWAAYRTDVASSRLFMVKRFDGSSWIEEGNDIAATFNGFKTIPTQKIILRFSPSGDAYLAYTSPLSANSSNVFSIVLTNSSGSWATATSGQSHAPFGMDFPNYRSLNTITENTTFNDLVHLRRILNTTSNSWSNATIYSGDLGQDNYEGFSVIENPIYAATHNFNNNSDIEVYGPSVVRPAVPNSSLTVGRSLQMLTNFTDGNRYLLYVQTTGEITLSRYNGSTWEGVTGLNASFDTNTGVANALLAKLNIRESDGRVYLTYKNGTAVTTQYLDVDPAPRKVYVSADATGANDGSSWSDAFTDIQSAIDAAENSLLIDTLWIKGGTYKPTTGTDQAVNIQVRKDGLKLFGGFAGTETTLSQRTLGLNPTIITGDLSDNDDPNDLSYGALTRLDNSYKLFYVNASDVEFNGFKITGGHANLQSSNNDKGAAIYKEKLQGNLTIKNCEFTYNVTRVGGAVTSDFGASGDYELLIENCKFSQNLSRYASGFQVLTDNSNTTANVKVFNSLFHNNIARDLSDGQQGLCGSSFAMFSNSGTINLEAINNTFSENVDAGTTSGNDRGTIGLRRLENTSNRVLNAEIHNNIFFQNYSDEAKTVVNPQQIGQMNRANPINIINFTHNNSNQTNLATKGTSVTETDNLDVDPGFVDTANENFALTSSAVVDAGDNAKVPADITTDLNGLSRIVNTTVDIGAFEYFLDNTAPTVVTKDFTAYLDQNGEVTVDPADFNDGSSDDIIPSDRLNLSLDVTQWGCTDLGENSVNLTVTDLSGNATSGAANLTVLDTISPTVVTRNITVELDVNGEGTITSNEVNNGSSDNCDIAQYTLRKTSFTTQDIGQSELYLIAEDGSGNIDSASFDVTVTFETRAVSFNPSVGQKLEVTDAISVKFNAAVDLSSVNSSTFLIHSEKRGVIAGSYELFEDSTITFTPENDFQHGENITIDLLRGIHVVNQNLSNPAYLKYIVGTEAGQNPVSFTTYEVATSASGNARPTDIVLADFDQDGDLDLLGSYQFQGIRWSENVDGFGDYPTLSLAGNFTSSEQVERLVPGDFNKDGIVDALSIASLGTSSGGGRLDRNSYTSSWARAGILNRPGVRQFQNVKGIAMADMSLDGRFQLLTVNSSLSQANPNPGILSITSGNTFQSFGLDIGDLNSVDVDDINGDGLPDVLIASDQGLYWYSNQVVSNQNTFDAVNDKNEILTVSIQDAQIADFDQDGDVDIACVMQGQLRLMVNDGAGNFTASFTQNLAVNHLEIGDMNGDGNFDIVSAGQDGVFFTENNGSGFEPFSAVISNLTELAAFDIGDIDGDGDLDVVAISKDQSGQVTVARNLLIDNNRPPSIIDPITAYTVNEDAADSTLVANLGDVFSDPDGDDLTYTVSSDTSAVEVTIVNDTSVVVSLEANYFGTSQIVITATDTEGNATDMIIDVTVNEFNLQVGLVGKFTFSGDAQDETGLLGTSVVVGATMTADRDEVPNSAYTFDGSDDYIEVPDNDLLDFGTAGDFTFSLWFRSEPSSGNKIFINKSVSTSGITTRMLADGTLRFDIRLGSQNYSVASPDSYDDGEWHHASFVLDKDSSQEIYVDGGLAASSSFSRTETLTNTSNLRFGTFAGGVTQVMLGELDDIYIHNRVLLPSEIKTLARFKFDLSEGLIGQFNFTANTLDATGNLGSATVVGAQPAPDRNGVENAAYTFDGTDDYLEVQDNDLLDFGEDGDFSFALWFKASPHNANRIFVHKGTATSGITLRMLQDGTLSFFMRLGAQNDVLTTTDTYDDGLWHQVVFTAERSQSNTQTIYVDGQLAASRNTSWSGTLTNASNLRFGTFDGDVQQVMKGELDDILIFNRAIRQQEAAALAGKDVNGAPQALNSITDLSIPEDAPETTVVEDLSALFVDPENDDLSFEAVSSEAQVIVNVISNELTVTPESNFFGSSVITVTANDGFGGSDTVAGTITVNAINDDPNFELSRTEVTLEQNFPGTENISLTDLSPENEVETITYSIDPASVAFANVNIDSNTGEISISAVSGESGSQVFTITADDGQTTATGTFTLEVLANQSPSIVSNISDQTFAEDAGVQVVVSDYTTLFEDPDGDDLTYGISSDNADIQASLSGNAVEVNSTADYFGSGTVTLTASDATLSTDLTFSVEITAVNDAPVVANPIADQTATEDESFSLQLSGDVFSDVDNATLTTSASGLPSWLSFDAANNTFTGTPANADVGSATITVTATDGELSVTEEFVITVENVNDAPTVVNAIADQMLQEDDAAITIDIASVFEDIDGDELSYALEFNNNAAATVSLDGTTLTITPIADANGSGLVTVSASDGIETGEAEFGLTINAVNDAPAFSLSETTLDLEAGFETQVIMVMPENVPSDELGQVVGYNLQPASVDFAMLSIDQNTGEIVIESIAGSGGEATITVIADDGQEENNTFELSFELIVNRVLASENEWIKAIEVYPNPFTEYLIIDAERPLDASLFSMDGKHIKSWKSTIGKIELDGIPEGSYLLKIVDGEKILTQRMIKVN